MNIPRINTPDGLFHNGDLLTGEPGTIVTAEWLNAVQAAFRSQSFFYESSQHYRTGDIRWFADDEAVPLVGNFYEAYHPDGCLGKDPRNPANRPDGWTSSDPGAPYYWLKHGKWIEQSTVGSPVPIQRSTVSSMCYVKYRGDAQLHKDKFWRLALVYPHLITNNIIEIAELRAEFIRSLDDGRGVDINRDIGSFQDATAIRRLIDSSYVLTSNTHIAAGIGARNIDGALGGGGSDTDTRGYDNFFYKMPSAQTAGVGDNMAFKVRSRNLSFLQQSRI